MSIVQPASSNTSQNPNDTNNQNSPALNQANTATPTELISAILAARIETYSSTLHNNRPTDEVLTEGHSPNINAADFRSSVLTEISQLISTLSQMNAAQNRNFNTDASASSGAPSPIPRNTFAQIMAEAVGRTPFNTDNYTDTETDTNEPPPVVITPWAELSTRELTETLIEQLADESCPISLNSLTDMLYNSDGTPNREAEPVLITGDTTKPTLYDYRSLNDWANSYAQTNEYQQQPNGTIASPLTRQPIYLNRETAPQDQPIPRIERIDPDRARALMPK